MGGIVHCDIKPQQFLFGCTNKLQQLYLVDFGLSSRYWGTRHMPMRNHVSLTGAARYASINAHRGIQQSRRDDLESIGYMFMQLLRRPPLAKTEREYCQGSLENNGHEGEGHLVRLMCRISG